MGRLMREIRDAARDITTWLIVLGILIQILVWGGTLWVIMHFVRKFW